MFELLKSLGGLGLAAPQVGIDARLFVTAWGEIFVNPKFHDCWDSTEVVEGCLSFPGLQVKKKRWLNVRLKDGSAYTGRWAITLQHEMAHLDGICIG
jgi:peptide deformylase